MKPTDADRLKLIVQGCTTMLMYIYDKIVAIITKISICIALFTLLNTLFKSIVNTIGDFVIYFIMQCTLILFLLTLLIVLYIQYKKYCNYYEIGFGAWCKLSDQLDWSPIRKKVLYSNNGIEKDSLDIIDNFYKETLKTFSPKASHKVFLLFVFVSIVSFFIGLGWFIINLCHHASI